MRPSSTAEGVETDAQRMRLIEEHTDAAQGYLFARPLDIEGVVTLLHDLSEDVDTLN